MSTKCLVLYVDEEDRAEDVRGDVLRNVRLVDPTTGREVGAAGYGAWDGIRSTVDAAVRDAIRGGAL